jgi:hypothetical protein
MVVFFILFLQMSLWSFYSLLLLKIIVYLSTVSAVFLLGFVAKEFFTWFRSRQDPILLLYAVALGMMCLTLTSMMIVTSFGLINKADEIRYNQTTANIININSDFDLFNVISSALCFIFLWISTALLLRYYSRKIGWVKYWIIVSIPLIYFLMQYQSILFTIFEPYRISDPILFGIISTLIYMMSKPIGGILFGIAFWLISKRVEKHGVRDYLRITAVGISLLITSSQLTNIFITPYPPFGLITESLVLVASYLFLIGIYSTAMSISRDSELRKFINTVVSEEVKLLDNIGFAHLEKSLVNKIVPIVQEKAQMLEHTTGVRTSLTDTDIKQYLEEILLEINNIKSEKYP